MRPPEPNFFMGHPELRTHHFLPSDTTKPERGDQHIINPASVNSDFS